MVLMKSSHDDKRVVLSMLHMQLKTIHKVDANTMKRDREFNLIQYQFWHLVVLIQLSRK